MRLIARMPAGMLAQPHQQPERAPAVPNNPELSQASRIPTSLQGHDVPPERVALIGPHIKSLAETALAISNELPLQADAADFVATLEAEER
jgi:hypothetical protein